VTRGSRGEKAPVTERELPPGEDFRDDEFADEADDGEPVRPCPACGAEMYEGADRCPGCGEYVVSGISRSRALPRWFWIGLAAALAAAIILAVSRFRAG
jgi:hypothetical protein